MESRLVQYDAAELSSNAMASAATAAAALLEKPSSSAVLPGVGQKERGTEQKLSRIVSLDAWRGLSLLAVYIAHCAAAAAIVVTDQPALTTAIRKFSAFGGFGLNFLFVLSGYLITRILLESRDRPHYYRNYFMRRTLRIFPLYYAFLVACLVVGPALFGRKHFLVDILHMTETPKWLWFYGTNIVMTIKSSWCFGSLIHLWSVAVEEQFYLAWPLVVALLPTKRVFHLSLALIAVSTIARCYFGFGLQDGIGCRVNTLCNMDCLAAGAAVAVFLMLYTKEQSAKLAKVLLLVAAIAFPAYAYFAYVNPSVSSVFTPTVGALAFSGLVIKTVLDPQSCVLWGHDVFRTIGKYSYGLYIFHLPIVNYIAQHWMNKDWPMPVLILGTFLLSWAIVAPLAVLSFHFYETPFLKLKDKFSYFKTQRA